MFKVSYFKKIFFYGKSYNILNKDHVWFMFTFKDTDFFISRLISSRFKHKYSVYKKEI